MKVLVFEWLIGGGLLPHPPLPAGDPLLLQGASMFAAVVDDCLKCGAEVIGPIDHRGSKILEELLAFPKHPALQLVELDARERLEEQLLKFAAEVDYIMLIAPESDGILCQCVDWLEQHSAHLICRPVELIKRFADKNRTQTFLQQNGIAVAAGYPLTDPATPPTLSFPLVVKPADGAGGDAVFVCHNQSEYANLFANLLASENFAEGTWRVEQFVSGVPVSVSLAQSDCDLQILPPTGQQFEGRAGANGLKLLGHYTGALFPLEKSLANRATALAHQVAQCIPQWRGYLGMDMILADDGNDVVVEINPRMTMSYCHLREATGVNVMQLLLTANASS